MADVDDAVVLSLDGLRNAHIQQYAIADATIIVLCPANVTGVFATSFGVWMRVLYARLFLCVANV